MAGSTIKISTARQNIASLISFRSSSPSSNLLLLTVCRPALSPIVSILLKVGFGWPPEEAYVQNDVHEFCRVLFDAIEQSMIITGEDASKMNSIYKGKFLDYVKCPECGYASQNTQDFQDLSLPVKSELTGVKNTSLEMALENYLKP